MRNTRAGGIGSEGVRFTSLGKQNHSSPASNINRFIAAFTLDIATSEDIYRLIRTLDAILTDEDTR